MSDSPRYLPQVAPARITDDVSGPLLYQDFGRLWWIGFGISAALTVVMVVSIVWLFWKGVGVWGVNTSNVWGFALANYVWWIGIGNAGTLISCMLLLTRQHWRAAISRFAAAFRRALRLGHLITVNHFDVMARILLFGATVLLLSYATEWFFAWYVPEEIEWFLVRFEFRGVYAPFYLTMLFCNCVLPQVFWFRFARRSIATVVIVAIVINIGMWLERILIVVVPPARGHLPSQWSFYWRTIWDWLLLLGTLGFFSCLFFLFIRLVPSVSMHETKMRMREERGG